MKNQKKITILGSEIKPGSSSTLNFNVAKLYTQNSVNIPVIVERAKTDGPTILITGGIHGDEINGVDIVRSIIAEQINKPKKGTIICIPVINVFGFIQKHREFPDGRDLNRVFPGSKNGSLASRVAHKLTTEILPAIDLVLDFHTGGADRFNAAQIRISNDETLKNLAKLFNAPFSLYSKHLSKSFRATCHKLNIPALLFEGGKSSYINQEITNYGINGVKRVLAYFDMLQDVYRIETPINPSIFISESKWIRAKYSGMFRADITINSFVSKGDILGYITDPYGSFKHIIKAKNYGYIININESPIVYQGDAIFHISTELE